MTSLMWPASVFLFGVRFHWSTQRLTWSSCLAVPRCPVSKGDFHLVRSPPVTASHLDSTLIPAFWLADGLFAGYGLMFIGFQQSPQLVLIGFWVALCILIGRRNSTCFVVITCSFLIDYQLMGLAVALIPGRWLAGVTCHAPPFGSPIAFTLSRVSFFVFWVFPLLC